MTVRRWVFIVLLGASSVRASDTTGVSLTTIDCKVLVASVHLYGLSIHGSYHLPYGFAIEAGYGYFRQHSIAADLVYRIERWKNVPFLFAGYGFQFKAYPSGSRYNVHCINGGVGFETNLGRHFFCQMDACGVKFLRQNFYGSDMSIVDHFKYYEAAYIQIGIGAGYRIAF